MKDINWAKYVLEELNSGMKKTLRVHQGSASRCIVIVDGLGCPNDPTLAVFMVD